MNPFYEEFKHMVGNGAAGSEDTIGDVYKGILYQRGYGLAGGYNVQEYHDIHGLGFGDTLMSMFKFALPVLKTGLQYLGKRAVSTAANIAQDSIEGKNVKEAAKEHITSAAEDIFGKVPQAFQNITAGRKRKHFSSGKTSEQATSVKQRKKQRGKNTVGKGLLRTYPLLEKII